MRLSDFVFKIAVPLLLFRTIAEADFHGASPFRLWIAYFSGVAITWTAGHIAATRFFGRDERIGVLAGVSSAFANNIFIGLPLVQRTIGDEGLVPLSILIAVHLPVMMIVGTILMERAERKIAGKAERSIVKVLTPDRSQPHPQSAGDRPCGWRRQCTLRVFTMPATGGIDRRQTRRRRRTGGAGIAGHGASEIRCLRQCRHRQRHLRLQAAAAARLRLGRQVIWSA